MAVEDDVIFVLVIKKKEEDTEKVRSEEEKQEDPKKEKREEDPEKKKKKVKREEGKEEDLKEKENEAEAAIHELPEIEKLNVVQATKRNVDILKTIRDEAAKANKRVHIVTFNQVTEAVENQIEYPREISFLVVEQSFSSEIQRVLKLPELRFIPCIIFSHTPFLVRQCMWIDGETKIRKCSADIIRQFMVGIWSEKYATMRREATKLDDALSTTEKTSSEEEEEEEEPDDGESDEEEEEPDDGEFEEEEEEEPDDGEGK